MKGSANMYSSDMRHANNFNKATHHRQPMIQNKLRQIHQIK